MPKQVLDRGPESEAAVEKALNSVGLPRFELGTSCTPNRPGRIGQEVCFQVLTRQHLAADLLKAVEPCCALVRCPLQNYLHFRIHGADFPGAVLGLQDLRRTAPEVDGIRRDGFRESLSLAGTAKTELRCW